ncbi:MAG TPA: alpha/beta fold hydrolase [Nocardioidaceae bacterium]|nr:alpha/beta fold hydrolase [Nocardioidaceae bacterium]
METQSVTSTDVTLAARDWPKPGAPTVILVHGYPDSQVVWEPVADRLAEQHGLRVITYDVRGAGHSTAPPNRRGYRIERLIDDLVAVMDQVAGRDARVHLVGHDWGSIQLWDAVTTEDSDVRLQGRLLSYTSIGGPSLDHMAHVFRRARNERDLNLLLRQGLNSWYIYAFQLPWLPEQLWRRATPQLRRRLAKVERLGDGSHWGDTFTRDATNGLDLYRANIQDRMRHPRSGKTGVPVQLIVPRHDKYIVPQVFADLDESVPELTRVDIDAGHWAAVQRPDLVADLIADHVRAHERS